MSRFAILLGGDVVRTPRLDAMLAGARVIAADSGMRHAVPLGVEPELWVGDFDSVSQSDIARHVAVAREVFPPDKDQTDGELAIDAALARGANGLVLVGAFGGPRADHAFLHMSVAIRLAERGVATMLTSGVEEGHPLLAGTEAHFDYAPGTLFSVLAFSALCGLSVEGAKWPLDNVEIAFGSSLTLSNEVAGRLRLSLDTGRAMLLAHPQPGKAD